IGAIAGGGKGAAIGAGAGAAAGTAGGGPPGQKGGSFSLGGGVTVFGEEGGRGGGGGGRGQKRRAPGRGWSKAREGADRGPGGRPPKPALGRPAPLGYNWQRPAVRRWEHLDACGTRLEVSFPGELFSCSLAEAPTRPEASEGPPYDRVVACLA